MSSEDHARELDKLLDDIHYELTAARGAGLASPNVLRTSLKRIQTLVFRADGLAATAESALRKKRTDD